MANEISIQLPTGGLTNLYAVIQLQAQIVNATSGALQSLSSGNWTTAVIALADSSSNGKYFANAPAMPAGQYQYFVYQNASPVWTDSPIGEGIIPWNGTAEILTTTPTVGQIDTQLSNTHGSGPWGSDTGTGAFTVTITVNDGSNPIQNATVSMSQGTSIFSGLTNSSGVIAFSLNSATYAVAITAAGYSFAPTTLVVTTNQTHTYSMIQDVIPTPPTIGTCNGYLTTYDEIGNIASGVVISFTMLTTNNTGAISASTEPFTATSSGTSSNNLVQQLWQNTTYIGRRGTAPNAGVEFTTGSTGTYALPILLGMP